MAEWGQSCDRCAAIDVICSVAHSPTLMWDCVPQKGSVTGNYAAMSGSADSMSGICIQLDTLYNKNLASFYQSCFTKLKISPL
jgi:hypothetical protein